ncbi:MAG: hypothetical protein HQ559_01510 [Lentisphaerae bacterium]|nr:hypothetical protein [Lentisphaerota bacterium]
MALPELACRPESVFPGTRPLCITVGDVPARLSAPTFTGVRYEVQDNTFLLRLEGIGSYLAADGCSVRVDPCSEAKPADVRLFLLGSTLAAILHQRELLPLHGSTIEIDGQAVSFLGTSGAGKSTLAAAFRKRGNRVLSDDVTVIESDRAGVPHAMPAYPQLKLWADAAEKLDEKPGVLLGLRSELEKRGLAVGEDFCPEPRPLRAFYILSPGTGNDISFERLTGGAKLPVLVANTYRLHFLEGMGSRERHFYHCRELASRVDCVTVRRPRESFRLDDLVGGIVEDLATPPRQKSV